MPQMTLGSGTRWPYEILSPVARAEMGEVYRARDTRLDRTVAVKILPRTSPTNADLRLRFEREARAVSSLNHAHICTLHDIGRQDGVDYLVMEYLEGETSPTDLRRGRSFRAVHADRRRDRRRPGRAHKQGVITATLARQHHAHQGGVKLLGLRSGQAGRPASGSGAFPTLGPPTETRAP